MVGIIDYGMGNVGSLLNMVERLGEPAITIDKPSLLKETKKLILPGVGSFDNGVKKLKAASLWDELSARVIDDKVPILCICLGMQLITNGSEEGKMQGLGWIEGKCRMFRFPDKILKIPHMGWNAVKLLKNSDLLADVPESPKFYFVHSYYVECKNEEDVLGTTSYGIDFVSMICRNNVFATQFHPEKSHRYGMGLIKSFLELC